MTRSFFKKPSWASGDSSNKTTSTEFYRRADQVYTDIVAEEKKKRVQKHNQKQTEIKEVEASHSGTPREAKRPRISVSVSDDTDFSEVAPSPIYPTLSGTPTGRIISQASREPSTATPQSRLANLRSSSTSPTKPKGNTTPPPARSSDAIINIDDSDSPEPIPPTKPATHQAPQPSVPVSDDEDDDDINIEEEFPELARKARERARLAAQSEAKASPESRSAPTPGRQLSRASEPTVEIIITSDIPNTRQLLVRRRLSQNLKDVRLVWCQRQGFSEEMTAQVFLTWRGKRVFDVTTCQSLGVDSVNNDSELFSTKFDEDHEYRVHMVAVTKEIFEWQRRETIWGSGVQDEGADEQDDADEEERVDNVRLTLQGPGIEGVALRVRPSTRISELADAVRKQRNIPADKTIHIFFDGECLPPDSVVMDSDIADMDCLDVVIK
ncbi:hypothetical protein VTO42DRAFT_2442 [Malbranchea cinnamomea]